ncbi:MAG: hypothetical protein ABSA82_01190 [Thermacetogeniaceae bacterium]
MSNKYGQSPRLMMWKNGEMFCGPTGTGRVRLPLFFLTNSLLSVPLHEGMTIMDGLRIWIGFLLTLTDEINFKFDSEETPEDMKDDLKSAGIQFQQYLNGEMEKPAPFDISLHGETITEEIAYAFETHSLQSALIDWLQPSGRGKAGRRSRKTPSQKYSEEYELLGSMVGDGMMDNVKQKYSEGTIFNKDYLITCVKDYFIQKENEEFIEKLETVIERNMQFHTLTVGLNLDKTIIKAKFETGTGNVTIKYKTSTQYKTIEERKVTTECFVSSQGFLPLVWAEILYAVRNDIFAQECSVCHDWFPIKPGKYNENQCSEECRKKLRADKEKDRRQQKKTRQIQGSNSGESGL